jgi:hypothetical protein
MAGISTARLTRATSQPYTGTMSTANTAVQIQVSLVIASPRMVPTVSRTGRTAK